MILLLFHVIVLLQSVTEVYEKARHVKGITKYDRLLLQSPSSITTCDRLLFKSASGNTKCDSLVLKMVSDITKCDSYYKVRHNRWDAALSA